MSEWRETTIGDVVTFQRGFDITRKEQVQGDIPVVSSGGITSYHNTAATQGPGVVIGRKGTLGKVFYMQEDYWPHDTTLWIKDFKGSDPHFVYYFMTQVDTSWLDGGSANPTLNRNHLHPLRIRWPSIDGQKAIAEVLGALDDKIAANTNLAATAQSLAGLIYDQTTLNAPVQAMSDILEPVLGGTPQRSRTDFWRGCQLWASAKDITGAPFGVVVDTDEKITSDAVERTKAKPLPIGSVILTARGTVGAVARLSRPSSFNQSCYGFSPGRLPAGILFHAVLRATQRAKALAHGSVFDTITMKTFNHLTVPDLGEDALSSLESRIAPLLETVDRSVRQNATLAATRDALLPHLVSGQMRVQDVKATVFAAL